MNGFLLSQAYPTDWAGNDDTSELFLLQPSPCRSILGKVAGVQEIDGVPTLELGIQSPQDRRWNILTPFGHFAQFLLGIY
jgi:hypothetical protein